MNFSNTGPSMGSVFQELLHRGSPSRSQYCHQTCSSVGSCLSTGPARTLIQQGLPMGSQPPSGTPCSTVGSRRWVCAPQPPEHLLPSSSTDLGAAGSSHIFLSHISLPSCSCKGSPPLTCHPRDAATKKNHTKDPGEVVVNAKSTNN